ncbi:hypothetical protein B296_00054895, partial [Ensete ventricosum]
FITSKSFHDKAFFEEGIPEYDDLKMLVSSPSNRVPSKLAEGMTLTLDEPKEDIRPDQRRWGDERRRTVKSRGESKGSSDEQGLWSWEMGL